MSVLRYRHSTGYFLVAVCAFAGASPAAMARGPVGVDEALERLAVAGKFSGAVVIRGADGVRFARGYGSADPFEGRPFTPDTPADSASLAKPFTSAAILRLASEGRIKLDAPVRRYLPAYPHSSTTVRQLLSHSAGLGMKETPTDLANKSNSALLADAGAPLFPPGTAFSYCNLCSVTLAILIERVSGMHYLDYLKHRVDAPRALTLRPARLAEWRGRAIGYRRTPDGRIERFDSWEGESFYGAANLSISAAQLAEWGSRWWQPGLAGIVGIATIPAVIEGKTSGLTLGNWYCAPGGRRCHYLGHHEGFHHMLYWDADQRISVAMLTNNALAPALHQRLQRALVSFASGRPAAAGRELGRPMPEMQAPVGRFRFTSGERVEIVADKDSRMVRRKGIDYPAYPVGSAIRYVPGLDVYVAGDGKGRLHWLSLYEDMAGEATRSP